MSTRRTARLSEAIRQTVSTVILLELRDPRIQDVTVTSVEAAGDLRTAKVYVSVMGDEKKQSLALHGLDSARGFIQSKVADRLQTRYTPVLRFVLDEGLKKSTEAARILREVIGPEIAESVGDPDAEGNTEAASELDGTVGGEDPTESGESDAFRAEDGTSD